MRPLPGTFARPGLWMMLLCALVVLGPGLHGGYWLAEQGFAPAWNAAGPGIGSGDETLWQATGPWALIPAQMLMRAGLDPVAAVKWQMLLSLLGSGVAVHFWLQRRLGDRAAAVAGVATLTAPLLLMATYTRGNPTELLLVALFALALAGAGMAARGRRWPGSVLAVAALLWLPFVQAGIALVALLLVVLYVLLVEQSWLVALSAAVVGGAALMLRWLTALGAFNLPGAESPAISLYGVLRAAPVAGEPAQLGLVILVLAGAALFAAVGLGFGENWARRLLFFGLGASGFLLLWALPLAAPLRQLLGAASWTNDPWQPLLLAVPLLGAAAGLSLTFWEGLDEAPLWAAVLVVLSLAAAPFLRPHYTAVAAPDQPMALLGENQVAVLAAGVTREPGSAQATLHMTWQVLTPVAANVNLFLHALADEDTAQVLAQLDSQPIADRPATTWSAGEIFEATWVLDLPPDAPKRLLYHAGFYDWRDGARLPVRRLIDSSTDDKLVFHDE